MPGVFDVAALGPGEIVALVIATSFAAGLNVYATTATLGLLARFEMIALPPELGILSSWWVIGVAVVLYLAPVFFAALVFAMIIRDEPQLGQAYGSNILGAVTGGVCEYLSLVFGLKFLNALILLFYLVVFLLLRRAPARAAAVAVPGAVPT